MKPDQLGSLLVQEEKYQEERVCDKRHDDDDDDDRFNTGASDICTTNSNNRIAATLYSLET